MASETDDYTVSDNMSWYRLTSKQRSRLVVQIELAPLIRYQAPLASVLIFSALLGCFTSSQWIENNTHLNLLDTPVRPVSSQFCDCIAWTSLHLSGMVCSSGRHFAALSLTFINFPCFSLIRYFHQLISWYCFYSVMSRYRDTDSIQFSFDCFTSFCIFCFIALYFHHSHFISFLFDSLLLQQRSKVSFLFLGFNFAMLPTKDLQSRVSRCWVVFLLWIQDQTKSVFFTNSP